jgi:hypothetical protein
LPNRSAAREEALAVVRDLADPKIGGWFLQVADESGGFFRTPIGHPALELVTPDTHEPHVNGAGLEPVRPVALLLRQDTVGSGYTAEIVRQMWTRRERTAQLLRANEQLRRELSSLCFASETIRVRTRQLVSLARATRD